MKKLSFLLLVLSMTLSVGSFAGSKQVSKEKLETFSQNLSKSKGSKSFLLRLEKVNKNFQKASSKYKSFKNKNSRSAKRWLKIARARRKWLIKYQSFWNKFYKKRFKMKMLEALKAFHVIEVTKSANELGKVVSTVSAPKLPIEGAVDGEDQGAPPVSSQMKTRKPQKRGLKAYNTGIPTLKRSPGLKSKAKTLFK